MWYILRFVSGWLNNSLISNSSWNVNCTHQSFSSFLAGVVYMCEWSSYLLNTSTNFLSYWTIYIYFSLILCFHNYYLWWFFNVTARITIWHFSQAHQNFICVCERNRVAKENKIYTLFTRFHYIQTVIWY